MERNITDPSCDIDHIVINSECTQPEAPQTNQETLTRDSIRMHVSAQHH
jgi:hypothetical protein